MTKRATDQLPDELVFEPDGHVGEIALACFADGELSLVPPEAMAHLDGCEVCTARLGTVALRSLGVGEALRADEARAEVATVLRTIAATAPASAVQAAVNAPAPVEAASAPSSRKRRPLPRSAIGAALLIAAIAAVPTWMDTLAGWRTLVLSAVRAAAMLARVAAMLLRSTPAQIGGGATALRWVAAMILIGLGVAVAGSRSRRRSLQGGVG